VADWLVDVLALNQGHALARFAGHGVRWGAEMFGTGS
jgi:hypothetical protein